MVLSSAAWGGGVEEGKKSIEIRMCRIYHTINNVGGLVGPDLNQVGIRRTPEWLLR